MAKTAQSKTQSIKKYIRVCFIKRTMYRKFKLKLFQKLNLNKTEEKKLRKKEVKKEAGKVDGRKEKQKKLCFDREEKKKEQIVSYMEKCNSK